MKINYELIVLYINVNKGEYKMKKNKALTKQMLKDMGITVSIDESGEYWVDRYWWGPGLSKKMVHKHVNEIKLTCHHKYTPDKVYPGYCWSYNGKPFTVSKSRLVYVYFIGDLKEGEEVDHIDNNPYNNALINLEKSTPEKNIKKRYCDLNTSCFNQYDNTKYSTEPVKQGQQIHVIKAFDYDGNVLWKHYIEK